MAAAFEGFEPVPFIDETAFRDLISGRTFGLREVALRSLLSAASILYRGAICGRNRLYDWGLLKVHRAGVPVISVGNLTTGGTGKTPVAALICERLRHMGRKPGLISRGYRATAEGGNDEKRVLELLVPGIPHIQQPDRVAAVNTLLTIAEHERPDVVVMDDGFQHRRLHRDLNLVLIDATCPFGFGAVLPRGLLREPLNSLRRADAVLLTRTNLIAESELRQLEQELRAVAPGLGERILRVNFEPVGLRDSSGQRHSLSSARGRSVFLMTAIGNPEAFRSTCIEAGLTIVGQRWFPDHHHYTSGDLTAVLEEARAGRAELLVTTVKDLVKIREHSQHFVALDIEAVVPRQDAAACLSDLLRGAFSSVNPAR